MENNIHSINFHDLPNKSPELLPALLGQISFNADTGQAFWVHNAQTMLSKVWNQYEYNILPLPLPLVIRLINLNYNSMDTSFMIKQVLTNLWSSMKFYLPIVYWGSIGRDRSESVQ